MTLKHFVLIASLIIVCYADLKFLESIRNSSIELIYASAFSNGITRDVVISPFEAISIVSGLSLGATGQTKKQVNYAFRLSKTKDMIGNFTKLRSKVFGVTDGVVLKYKIVMFVNTKETIEVDYKNTAGSNFHFNLKYLDFNDTDVSKIANKYLLDNDGLDVFEAKDFLQSKIVLGNVFEFKGLWTVPFNVGSTRLQPFYNKDGRIIGNVDMMNKIDKVPFGVINELEANMIEITYGEDELYSMVIMLPNDGDLIRMYKGFANLSLTDALARIRLRRELVDIKIPRFEIRANVLLKSSFEHMGIYSMFDPSLATFPILSRWPIHVSTIAQQVAMKVTEAGATLMSSNFVTRDDKLRPFEANKPFMYLIMEKRTDTVVLGGVYVRLVH